jgi:hypothetical protein
MTVGIQPHVLPVIGTHNFQPSIESRPRYAYRALALEAYRDSRRPQSPRYNRRPLASPVFRPPASLAQPTLLQHRAARSAIGSLPSGMAAMIGLSEAALLRDPLAGLQALYRRFGESDARQRTAGGRFSAYPVRFKKHDLLQWKQPVATLPAAIADTACVLLMQHDQAILGEHVIAGVCLHDALRQRHDPGQLHAAIATGLVKLKYIPSLNASTILDPGKPQADWLADILLCKYASALGRSDAPRHLIYGGVPWARRQLAIANYDARRNDHWAVRDVGLLVENRRYTGGTEALEQVALQYCHAQGLLDLSGTAPDQPVVAQAIAVLREALATGMALPAGPDGSSMLQPDWIDRINWKAFDAVAFLLANGAQSPFDGTASWWMTALRACFEPILAPDRAPLDVRGMDSDKLQLFAGGLLRSQGYGDTTADALSPFLLQTMIDSFFRSVVAPAAAEPFHRALNHVTRPISFLRCNGGGGVTAAEPGTPRILRSVATVKRDLDERLFRQDDMACPAVVKQWALPVFCSIFLPALGRYDLPDQMAYGGVDWTILDIATSTIGDAHWGYRTDELLQFGRQVDVFSGLAAVGVNATHADLPQSAIFAVDAALRMAHCAGVIDAGAKNTKSGRAQIEKALALLQDRLSAAAGQSNPLNAVRAAVPRRIDTARALLREYAVADPDQEFTMASTLGGYLNMAVDTPMAWDTPHPLYKIFMEGGLQQLLTYGDLPDWQRTLLQQCRDNLSLHALNTRFEREFDAAIIALSDTVLIPLMLQEIQALPVDRQQAWQCGRWNVRIPRAQVETSRPLPLMWGAQAMNSHAIKNPLLNMIAGGAVLVDLHDADGDPQTTQHYWVSLKPFRFKRYDGDVATLLRENLQIFFKPGLPDQHLVKLAEHPNLHYYDASASEKNSDGQGGVLALIATHLLAPAIAPLRQAARGITESEHFAQLVSDIFLNMLPFYSCVSSLQSNDRIDSAGFFCVLDIAGVASIAGVAGKTMNGVARLAAGLSKRELKALASGFAARNLARGDVFNSVSTTFSMASSIRHLGKETLYFLDPGIRAASSVANYARQLGKDGSRALMLRLRNAPGTRRIRSELSENRRNGRWFFQQQGFWCARPEKIEWDGGERILMFDESRYSVMAIGGSPNVLVLRGGRGVRLADPRSGLCYGPLIRTEGAQLRDSRRPVLSRIAPRRDVDAATPSVAPGCRARRSPPASLRFACRLIDAQHFGPDFYQFEPGSMGWMLTQRDPLNHLSPGDGRLKSIDPASAGYRSYRYEHNILRESNFFVWGHRLWERWPDSSLHPTIWDVELPDTLLGHTLHTMTRTHEASLYIKVDFPVGENDVQAAFRNTQIVPLGSYALTDKTPMCMAEIGGEFYTFKMSLLTPEPGVAVLLHKASDEQQEIFYTYYKINNAPIDELIVGRLRRLRDCTPEFQARIDLALTRAGEMVADAAAFCRAAPASVDIILRNFVQVGDTVGATILGNRIARDIADLAQTIGQLQLHKQAFLGFARMDKRGADPVLALSLLNSMRYDIDPAFINKPLIYIDPDEVMLRSVDMLAAYILHEATHTRLGTLDSLRHGALEQVYVRSSPDGYVDIADLIVAAREEGNDPGVHAATLENLLVIFAYGYRGERNVANIFAGRSTVYRRKPD